MTRESGTIDGTQAAPAALPTTRALGLLVICAAQFLVALDLSIVNVAVPAMTRELGFDPGSAGWVLSAYALAFAAMLLLGGRIADLYGRKRVFVTSLLVLGAASLLAGAAWSPTVLIAGRVLQGLAAGFIAPSALGLLTASIPEGPQRERALGISGAVLSTGFVSGMIGGGLLTEFLTWRWTIFINVPVVIVAAALAVRWLPESRVRERSKLDVRGGLLSAGAMMLIVYALEEAGPGTSWVSTTLLLAVGVGLVLLFVLCERRSSSPLLPLSLFRIGAVGRANLVGMAMGAAHGGMLIILTLYLQQVLGYGALATGLAFALSGTVAILTGTFTGRFMQRWPLDRVMLFGIAVTALGYAGLIALPEHGGLWLVLVATSIDSFGHIIVVVASSVAANNGVPADHKAVAGAVLNTSQQLGIALGVAVLTSVAFAVTAAQGGAAAPGAMVDGWRWALALGTLVILSAAPLAIAMRKKLRTS
ncbi:MFS transporter [Kibdelosporangium aridum]|uniref:Drug resistance transporter, EmrB/QacA subfamily n=1 Tax=Kibdelosporangium aridum TaxID=2030 RepID=A0A1Y5X2V4_KIBAR|nr:MFS transporter [Kibdelosporangium aridum]SMC66684.1 drug resistance transporter, EmrB/QacA subfamily [Kibdelosporangium aridum]